ncbi:Uncharacterised protein [Halioglobus japonicus]|nr:Uncharacterised protein [Halioglobus japonicus]
MQYSLKSAALTILSALALCAQAAPDLTSRNTLDAGLPAGVAATGGSWTAVGEKTWRANGYWGAIPEYYDYSASVLVTGPWDGSPVSTHIIRSQKPQAQVFGEALSLEGNRLAIGAPSEGFSTDVFCEEYICDSYIWRMRHPGQVYLYQFDGSTFAPERSITRGNELSRFGHALALSQAQLLVGAPGTVPGMAYLFSADTGDEIQAFTSPTTEADDDFGSVVAFASDLLVISAPASSTVYIYDNEGSGWHLLAELTHPEASAEFGAALSADNSRVLIGAPGIDKAFLYDLADIPQGQPVPVSGSDWLAAEEFSGPEDSRFGHAVALLGDTAWISAPAETIDGQKHGVVRQFEYTEVTGWAMSDSITASAVSGYWNDFGSAVAVSADRLTITSVRRKEQDIFTSLGKVYDPDGDTIAQIADNCIDVANIDQNDLDADGIGDVCDDDIDGDNLTNEEEEILGTDPLNADTDGDGLRDDTDPVPLFKDADNDGLEDPNDNCPMNANPLQENIDGDRFGDVCDDDIDNDSLLNSDEIASGSDPFKKDSDDDGFLDDYDTFPADANDGWTKVFRFPLSSSDYVAVDGDLALAANEVRTVQAYARMGGKWDQIAAPDLAALNAWRIEGMAMSGTTAAFLVNEYNFRQPGENRPAVLIYHWSPQSGWVYAQGISPPFLRSYTDEIRLKDDLLVIVGSPEIATTGSSALVEIYQNVSGSYQHSGSYSTDGAQYMLEAQISGGKVFVGDDIKHSSDPTMLHVMSAAGEIEASIPTSIKDSTSSSSCSNPSNSPLVSADDGKIIVSTEGSDYWVQQSESDGSWQLEEVVFGNNNIAGLGSENRVGLEHPVPLVHPVSGKQTEYNLKVLSMVDGSTLGLIPGRKNYSCWLNWATDGHTVITASDDVVEIYPLDDVGTPGDLDGNNQVDIGDYLIIRSALGSCEGDTGFIGEADYTGDSCVAYDDYQFWMQNYYDAQSLPPGC